VRAADRCRRWGVAASGFPLGADRVRRDRSRHHSGVAERQAIMPVGANDRDDPLARFAFHLSGSRHGARPRGVGDDRPVRRCHGHVPRERTRPPATPTSSSRGRVEFDQAGESSAPSVPACSRRGCRVAARGHASRNGHRRARHRGVANPRRAGPRRRHTILRRARRGTSLGKSRFPHRLFTATIDAMIASTSVSIDDLLDRAVRFGDQPGRSCGRDGAGRAGVAVDYANSDAEDLARRPDRRR